MRKICSYFGSARRLDLEFLLAGCGWGCNINCLYLVPTLTQYPVAPCIHTRYSTSTYRNCLPYVRGDAWRVADSGSRRSMLGADVCVFLVDQHNPPTHPLIHHPCHRTHLNPTKPSQSAVSRSRWWSQPNPLTRQSA